MKIPKEVQCRTCGQVFCCAKCRQKHEDKSHQEVQAIRQICYICNNRPFPLRTDTKITTSNVLIQHLMTEHLPLRCNRCSKVFLTISDFKAIVRCTPFGENNANGVGHACSLEHSPNIPTIMETPVENYGEVDNKENIDENGSLSDQSSANRSDKLRPATAIKAKAPPANVLKGPKISEELLAITDPNEQIEEPNEALLTPLSKINLRWKRKSQTFDSLNGSSNLSAFNTSEVPNSARQKLARTTSTPMMHGYGPNAKCSNDSYSSALGQMSSIHHSASESSYVKNDDHTPISPASYELEKVRAIIKSRSKVAATPLRQVMSKSIQRAIAQHGRYTKMVAPGTQRKMSFNSTGSSATNSTVGSPSRNALDLRTTPVLKRSSSETCVGGRKSAKVSYLQKAQSEESGLYQPCDMTESQYFDAHQSETSFEEDGSVNQENCSNHKIDEQSLIANELVNLKAFPSYYYQDTPKIAGGILKKVISFTTPEMTRIGEHEPDPNESSDLWATPCSVPPRSFSCSALQETGLNSFVAETSCDDVFLPPTRSKSYSKLKADPANTIPNTGKLWTIVSNVIRLASRSDVRDELGTESSEYSSASDSGGGSTFPTSLVRKATSFAGFLRNRLPGRQHQTSTSPEMDELPSPYRSGASDGSTKRRRTNSVYTRPSCETVATRPISSPLAKRKRIQGRQPIERMRNSSRGSSGSDF
ncbi:AAEL007813-PA [Aedes aegypti]|uniref:AAEL007813-PA n=2 Tax=Aedes aegypti TaxID=7159 RepID=A0A1S4FHW1_AEDAE|nr:mitosis initiation protein fs(1)Ya [Aedes aegypti]EAT40459.1 AAEL007813-PA [Aedes aegypti]